MLGDRRTKHQPRSSRGLTLDDMSELVLTNGLEQSALSMLDVGSPNCGPGSAIWGRHCAFVSLVYSRARVLRP